MTLSQYATDRKTGKIKRGALARIAEFMDVSKPTVKRWITGEWQPCIKTKRRIQDMIHARISLAPKKVGRPVKVQVVEEVHSTRRPQKNLGTVTK